MKRQNKEILKQFLESEDTQFTYEGVMLSEKDVLILMNKASASWLPFMVALKYGLVAWDSLFGKPEAGQGG